MRLFKIALLATRRAKRENNKRLMACQASVRGAIEGSISAWIELFDALVLFPHRIV